uniref:Uncharacterized protein n=1 Tax=Cucumis melo TaxID=3656 RepID=A0A9I9ECA8_CUCME
MERQTKEMAIEEESKKCKHGLKECKHELEKGQN